MLAYLCTSIVSICPQALQLRLTGPVRRGTEDRGLRSSQGLRLLPYLLAEGAAAARKQRGRIPKEAGGGAADWLVKRHSRSAEAG